MTPRLKVTMHAITRARERCPGLRHAAHQDVENAIRNLVDTGAPLGRMDKGGPRHVLGTVHGVALVVALIPDRDEPRLLTQTVLTLEQATANALAFPGDVAAKFKQRVRCRKVRG